MKCNVENVIPRCPGCKSHSDYIIINKKTGEKKYFCKMCGDFHLYKYSGENWEIIELS